MIILVFIRRITMFLRNIFVCICRKRMKYGKLILFTIVFIAVCALIVNNINGGIASGNSRSLDPHQNKKAESIHQVCTGGTGNCDKLKYVFMEISKKIRNGNKHVSIPALFDFDKQPCVAQLTPSDELEKQGGCVRTLNRSDIELSKDDSECVNLTISDIVTPVCIYNTSHDVYISAYLRSTGTWENELIFGITRLLNIHKDSILLDLGCNVGTFTLAAAKAQKHVVSVDPLLSNLELLSKSLYVGNLTQNVTLVWNAVSLERSTVTLQRYNGNVGGTAIKEHASPEDNINDSVNTIILDDIRELFIGKPTIIKMDVETQELNTLRSGELFFQTIDVRVVLLEFNWHRNRMSGIDIFTFLEGHGFMPFSDGRGHMPLNIAERRRWPGEVFFLKQEYFQDFLKNV